MDLMHSGRLERAIVLSSLITTVSEKGAFLLEVSKSFVQSGDIAKANYFADRNPCELAKSMALLHIFKSSMSAFKASVHPF
ncbi:MAG: hypothetical protein EBZ47_02090 [Chlamydiae bacterium]|nr:hypothetical protein [Chlamydiota bacterium]